MNTTEYNLTEDAVVSLLAMAQGIIQIIDERAPQLRDTATYQGLRQSIVKVGGEDVGQPYTFCPSPAYTAGYDCGLNGANETNCLFSIFSSPEGTKEWQRGKFDGEAARSCSAGISQTTEE